MNEGVFSPSTNVNSPNANKVSLRWIDRIVHSFGRFFSKDEAPKVYEFMLCFAKGAWFHGEVPRYPTSEDWLRGRSQGTFLIRTRDPFGYNLTFIIYHFSEYLNQALLLLFRIFPVLPSWHIVQFRSTR